MPRADPSLSIRLLGPLEIAVAGRPIVVDTRKALAIVALVAGEGRPFARDELAAMFWPEADDEAARGALRRTLSALRTAVGGVGIVTGRAQVALDPAASSVDLAELERLATSSRLADLEAAAALARGPFLAGFALRDSPAFDDWQAARAMRVERTVGDLLDRLAAARLDSGDPGGAVEAARRRVDLDPLDEPGQRRLMALLARSGDRGGAIRQYRACVSVLERELGVTPLAETTELYEAIRDARAELDRGPLAEAPALPPAPGRLPHVGRDAEFASVLVAHGSATEDGRVVAVIGEAGIGKSRLVEAVADAVGAAGGRSLLARAFASEAGIAYGPIVELLRTGLARPDAVARLRGLPVPTLAELARLAPLPDEVMRGLAPRIPTEPPGDWPAARARLLEAVAAALAALTAGPVPGLIAVEDLQWADDASREALAWLARRLAGQPLLLLLTWRPEDMDAFGTSFATIIEALPGTAAVTLHRLGRSEVGELVAAAVEAGLQPIEVGALLEESEGLPLYLVEALAAGAGSPEGPARSVRTLLRERLATVGETAAQVLSAGAVIGRSFDLQLVRGTSGRSEDETITALEELVRRGIVRELDVSPSTAFDFAHAKLRDAAYEATSLARRRLLHRRTADLLRAESAGRDDPGRLVQIATHERGAGRDAEAAEAFREAGFRARALYANREAGTHFETALALGHPDAAGLQLALGEVRTALGDYVGAIAALEASAAVAPDDALPAVEFRLGRVHARRGDLATAASHLDAAIESLERRPRDADADLLVRALVERAVVALRAGELDRAAASASGALALAERIGDATGAGAAHRILGLVARERGDLDGARASLGQSLALAEADPDAGAVIAARNALALVEAAAGDHPAAIALLEGALEACRRTGERHLEAAVENNLADQLHAAGRPDEAMLHLKRAVTLFAEVGGRPGELEPEIWKLVAW